MHQTITEEEVDINFHDDELSRLRDLVGPVGAIIKVFKSGFWTFCKVDANNLYRLLENIRVESFERDMVNQALERHHHKADNKHKVLLEGYDSLFDVANDIRYIAITPEKRFIENIQFQVGWYKPDETNSRIFYDAGYQTSKALGAIHGGFWYLLTHFHKLMQGMSIYNENHPDFPARDIPGAFSEKWDDKKDKGTMYYFGGSIIVKGGENPKVLYVHREYQLGDIADMTVVEKHIRSLFK